MSIIPELNSKAGHDSSSELITAHPRARKLYLTDYILHLTETYRGVVSKNINFSMKKLKFLAFALIAALACVGFASCGDDDDDEVGGYNPFVGTWVGTMYEEGGYTDPDYDEVVTMTFTADGKMTANCPEEDWYFSGVYKFVASEDYPSKAKIAFWGSLVDGDGNNCYEDEDVYDDDAELEYCYFENNALIISFDGSDYKLYRQ